jgi:O-antigen/teichoic acid export membrane protein
MSTTRRIISGTASSWARIVLTLLTQVLLVPIYLAHWSVKIYGIWIALQAVVNLLSTIDRGYNDFLEYEFLRLGPRQYRKVALLLWSGVRITLLVGLTEVTLVYLLSRSHLLSHFFASEGAVDNRLFYDISWSLFVQWVAWSLTNVIGLLFRSLYSFGYFPRAGWWNVLTVVSASLMSLIAVTRGGGLLAVSLYAALGTILVLICQLVDIRRLLLRQQLHVTPPSYRRGLGSFRHSMGLSFRYFLENFRLQGARLILLPFCGPIALASFSTVRTGANVAQQGLLTITHPILPELMRFLREKNQPKMEASFSTVWLVLVLFLCPGIVIAQSVAPRLFALWTRGHIDFSPVLFATLSLGVLVYALAQPAMAVMVGNNLVRKQMLLSLLCSVAIIIGMTVLLPIMNIQGAGISLLLAEIIAAVGYQLFARQWLRERGLSWPGTLSAIAALSILLASLGIAVMIASPSHKWLALSVTMVALCWNAKNYTDHLPSIARDKIISGIARVCAPNR